MTHSSRQGPPTEPEGRSHPSSPDSRETDIVLEPCPFCGGPAMEMAGLVGCLACACGRRNAQSWNRRAYTAEITTLRQRVKELEAVVEADYEWVLDNINVVEADAMAEARP